MCVVNNMVAVVTVQFLKIIFECISIKWKKYLLFTQPIRHNFIYRDICISIVIIQYRIQRNVTLVQEKAEIISLVNKIIIEKERFNGESISLSL